jgi:uncharacterized protein (TIGR02271 family)
MFPGQNTSGRFGRISERSGERSVDIAEQSMSTAVNAATTAMNTAMNTGFAWLDLMLGLQRQMQRASLQSMSVYSPTADVRIAGRVPQSAGNGTQVVAVGEERLNVATRTVQGETTRIRRRVVAQPVEQQVTLREEKVVVERRKPSGEGAPKPDVLTETVVEMSDSREVPTVWKSLHVAEEVVLRKQVTERTEKVRDTVRRDVVDVERARETLPAPVEVVSEAAESVRQQAAALRHAAEEERQSETAQQEKHGERRAHDEHGDKKPQAPAIQPPGRKS